MSVQVRFGDGGITDIDEIVTGTDAQVHLERMDTAHWSLIIETPTSRSHFSIRKKGKEVVVTTVEIDMTGGYATRSPPVKPDHTAQCDRCYWRSGGPLGYGSYCYMFKETPTGPCGARKLSL